MTFTDTILGVLSKALPTCGVEGCKSRGVASCTRCSKSSCAQHLFVGTSKPQVLCAACIHDDVERLRSKKGG